MDSSDEDEELKRAIALSLQEQESQVKLVANNEVIDLDSDDETKNDAISALAPSVPVPASHSFQGLDRKAMEQERLARKRKASISPPPPLKFAKQSIASIIPPSSSSSHIHSFQPSASLEVSFLDGVVKKTWAFGYERKDDIKIEEVLKRDHLSLAVLSSFQWDVEWLLSKLNTRTTQLYFVMQAKDDATKRQYQRETASWKNLRLCFPSMEGQVNCMHSKLILLSYPTHLRVAVPTANLVPYDWGETGVMENMLFLIDLPRLPDNHQTPTTELTAFGKDLVYFLQAMGLEETVVQSVHKFDFTRTKDLAFVHTIGGAHTEEQAWRRTGYCGLGRAVQQLGLETHKSLNIDFVTSSVGSLNMDFLVTLYLAAQGDDGLTEYNWRNSKKARAKTTSDDRKSKDLHNRVMNDVDTNLHIYFPTRDAVVNSKGGAPYGGTICFQSKWYDSPTFPRQLLRDCRSRRKGLLMHNKVCESLLMILLERCVFHEKPSFFHTLKRPLHHHKQPTAHTNLNHPQILLVSPKETTQLPTTSAASTAWAYVGSANCSESAWGKLSKDRLSKAPKLNCRNWECGVLIPMRLAQQDGIEKVDKESSNPEDHTRQNSGVREFEGRIPVPMQYPGEEYGIRRPWFNAES